MKTFRFLVSALLGLAFFALPIRVGERLSVPFDLVIQAVISTAPEAVAVYCLLLILVGAAASLASLRKEAAHSRWLEGYRSTPPLLLLRLLGLPLAIVYVLGKGPAMLLQDGVAQLMWSTLAFSVAVIVPLGAALLVLLVRYGFLEFVGTLMRPIMRPLFRLPGRAALDSLTSWIGSYSVGLYLTRSLARQGLYSRREAYTIVTCFSTVSIGFVAVVAQTLGMLNLFPVVFATYFVAVYLLTAVLARTWPIASVSDEYLAEPRPEPAIPTTPRLLLREAWRRALSQAGDAPGFARTLIEGFLDGLALASTILGSILTVGTAALLLARETPLFTILGAPLLPLLELLRIPDAEIVGPAVMVGIAEMYIPALLAREAAAPARFFVCTLSISQLIFFSSVGPMILDMFRDVPVRARELVALFLLRTALLIPLLALVTAGLAALGLFD